MRKVIGKIIVPKEKENLYVNLEDDDQYWQLEMRDSNNYWHGVGYMPADSIGRTIVVDFDDNDAFDTNDFVKKSWFAKILSINNVATLDYCDYPTYINKLFLKILKEPKQSTFIENE